MNVKLIGLGDLDEATGTRECFFEVNGFPRSVKRLDETASSNVVARPNRCWPSDALAATMRAVRRSCDVLVGSTTS